MPKAKTFRHVSRIEVHLWGHPVGRLAMDPGTGFYAFRYDPAFPGRGGEPAPLQMPVNEQRTLVFPNLSPRTYQRLPAMVSDSLPDRFGNRLIEESLRSYGVDQEAITALDRLANMSDRTMGALQFKPARGEVEKASAIELETLVAKAAGIAMTECRLHEEGGRAHFMTCRFDRDGSATRHHIQTLCAMAHMDFGMAGAFSYGQLFETILKLGLPDQDLEQAFRRMVFNVLARNLDDHTKNVSFRLRQGGRWELAPAYDLTFAHNPNGAWNHQHFLSVNGRHDGIGRTDILVEGERYSVGRARAILEEVRAAVSRWKAFCEEAGVPSETAARHVR